MLPRNETKVIVEIKGIRETWHASEVSIDGGDLILRDECGSVVLRVPVRWITYFNMKLPIEKLVFDIDGGGMVSAKYITI